jgi:tetratricopeptide (TPR) repeat protein
MASGNDNVPTKEEIKTQLARMLGSERFAANENPAKFLAFVVSRALRGERITQAVIGLKLFPRKYVASDITDVRVTASNLRKVLAAYYGEEGAEDLVLIGLPTPPRGNKLKLAPGKAYKPLFSYNPRSAAEHAYREGMRSLNNIFGFFDFAGAGRYFKRAIAAVPTHAPAHAAKAEVQLMGPMMAPYARPAKLYASARASAQRALRLNPKLWRPHVVLGAFHACRYEWKSAQAHFDRALEIDRTETRYHPWYAAFLLAVGKKHDALELVALRAKERPEDPFAQAIHGLFVYAVRDYAAAELLLESAIHKNVKNWVACFAYTCLYMKREHQDGYGARMTWNVQNELEMDVFPGLYILALCNMTPMDKETLGPELGRLQQNDLQDHDYWSNFQMAMINVGMKHNDRALKYLRQAFKAHEPYMAWLHIWPFLDPLRNEEGFKALVRRMKLPA